MYSHHVCMLREIFAESCPIKTNLDCNYTFPMDLASNGIPFGGKPIGKAIMCARLRTPLKPPLHCTALPYGGVQGGPLIVPHYAARLQSL